MVTCIRDTSLAALVPLHREACAAGTFSESRILKFFRNELLLEKNQRLAGRLCTCCFP